MPLVNKKRPANEVAFQAELQRNRNPLGLRNMNIPSYADDYSHHRRQSHGGGGSYSNSHEDNFFNRPGHRLQGRNLEERGITALSSSEVVNLLEEIKTNGPKAIPSHIKAVVTSNKFGYKFVNEKSGRVDYKFDCSKGRYYGKLPRGWGTIEEIGRAAIFAKETIYGKREGFTGVLNFIQRRIDSIVGVDNRAGRKLAEGHTALTRLGMYSRPQTCFWTRFSLTYDTYSRTAFSIDRRKEEPFNDKEAHSNENCVLSCTLANGTITWTEATHAAFFMRHAEVSNILVGIIQDPKYDYEAKLEMAFKSWAAHCNKDNRKDQKFYDETLPVITPAVLRRRFQKQVQSSGIGFCRYSGLPLPPVHKCKAFVASIEREFVLLPYQEDNIIFVSCVLNVMDKTKMEFFEIGETNSINNPELKARGSRGWNEMLVGEVRRNFASEKGSDSALSVASTWE